MTGSKRKAPQPREKRPPLTHFLCLPLVNLTSISQLEASISAFQKKNPPVPVSDLLQNQGQPSADHASRTLIPEGAIRPLGTLHLTLGVMSLPSKNRLDEAVSFLQSLDLANLMHEAEQVALRRKIRNSRPASIPAKYKANQSSKQLSISLESLHALPRAKSATVLHASPVDPTGRLYPFCVMLRDKFLEAGFLVGESKEKEKENTNTNTKKEPGRTSDAVGKQMRPESISSPETTKLDPYTAALNRQPKLRPLLLHATIVNTIYVRGRPKPVHGSKSADTKGKNTVKRFEFDARDLCDRYNDYYTDAARTVPRVETVSTPPSTSLPAQPQPKYPFVWAKGIPIDSVTICEMGARKLNLEGDSDGLKARLGQEYTVVASRSLNFR
ncbi:hypothetical protein N7486_007337 [Penicillium sp. IBT 16267x]|nr:hypothetical protein N7486_007337 [Penicillium sp. IBT 16267x]